MPEIIKDPSASLVDKIRKRKYITEVNEERLLKFIPRIKNDGFLHNEILIIATSINHQNPKLSLMTWGSEGRIPLEVSINDMGNYQSLIAKQRCLIFTDGFYVNRIENLGRTPYYVQSVLAEPLVLAGIWISIKLSNGTIVSGCSILTKDIPTESKMGYLNNLKLSCPVILNENKEFDWINYSLSHDELLKMDFDDLIQAHTILPTINLKKSNPYDNHLTDHVAYNHKPTL